MKKNRKRIQFHVLFWVVSWLFLAWFLTRLTKEYYYSFILTSLIWFIAIGTTYVSNYLLIPRFLLTKKYLQLALFSLFCLLVSLWLELLGIVAIFYYLLTVYSTGQKGVPFLIDPVFLIAGQYLIVFTAVVLRLIRVYNTLQKEKIELENRIMGSGNSSLSNLAIRSDRKEILIPEAEILYIQAMGDYVIIFREPGNKHMTIETLTGIYKRLPQNEFIRIHRSYIVNRKKITAIGTNSVEIGKMTLPMSRKYKSGILSTWLTLSC